jgi:hypothetical protein
MRLIKAFHRHDWTPPRQMAALRIVCDYNAAFRRVEWCFTAAIPDGRSCKNGCEGRRRVNATLG